MTRCRWEQGDGRGSFPSAAAGSTAVRTSPLSRLPIAAVLAIILGAPAAAQVGHDPEHSPFRDIRKGSALSFGLGWFAGDAGTLEIGPTGGPTATGRFELSLGGPTMVTIGASVARLERTVLDPFPDTLPPRSGPFDTEILMFDLGLQLRLTGQKSYHRVAPYLGAAMGLAFDLSGPSDPGGYTFGTKFTIAPGGGIRVYPGRHLSLTADFRLLFWRLNYPLGYQAGATPLLDPGASTTDWTTHPWTTVGVAWTF